MSKKSNINLSNEMEQADISTVVERLREEGYDSTTILTKISELDNTISNQNTWTKEERAQLLISGAMTESEYQEALRDIKNMGLDPSEFEKYRSDKMLKDKSE